MVRLPTKPKGKSGPISFGPRGVEWHVIDFPDVKAEREKFVAKLFVDAFGNWVATESDPSLKPFSDLIQSPENDLDFSVTASRGPMSMELAEFAPLQEHGPKFDDSPGSIDPIEKATLALSLVRKKSDHQGGNLRFLVVYATEHGFWLDPITIERMRRELAGNPPKFERVYWISIHGQNSASVSEIYPGTPHHTFGKMDLDSIRVITPHPREGEIAKDSHGT